MPETTKHDATAHIVAGGFGIKAEGCPRCAELIDTPDRLPIEELIEQSSLGTPAAKALRARTSDAEVAKLRERIAKVRGRAKEIREGLGETRDE